MKLTFRSVDGSLTVEAEPKTLRDAFEAIGQINEFLIANPCGCCKSTSTYPQAKHTKEFVFYEHKCRSCGATFSFGQTKEGGRLFPKTTDKEGNVLPNKGWSIYKGDSSSGGNYGSDGYRDPLPSRQVSSPPSRSSDDDQVPF